MEGDRKIKISICFWSFIVFLILLSPFGRDVKIRAFLDQIWGWWRHKEELRDGEASEFCNIQKLFKYSKNISFYHWKKYGKFPWILGRKFIREILGNSTKDILRDLLARRFLRGLLIFKLLFYYLMTPWSQNWAKKGPICILFSKCDNNIKFNSSCFFEVSNLFSRPVFLKLSYYDLFLTSRSDAILKLGQKRRKFLYLVLLAKKSQN